MFRAGHFGLWGAAVAATLLALGARRVARAGAAADGDVVVTVMGESAHSFEEAEEDALRKAVESGAGKEVFSDSRVADLALLYDTVVSRAAGYVKSCDVLGRDEAGGAYTVRIRAVVAAGRIRDDWGALQVLLQRKGRPNLLVVCFEEAEGFSLGASAAEHKLRELLGERGFDLVDDEALARVVGRDADRAVLAHDARKAAAVAQQLHADYIVQGRAAVRAVPARDVYGVSMVPVAADLYVKVVAASNAQQLASKSASARRFSEDAGSAAKAALDLAAREVEPEIVRRILERWSRDLDAGVKVEILGTRIPTPLLHEIVEGLRTADEVETVHVVDHNEELTTLSVVTSLEARLLGQALEKAAGGSPEVTGYRPGRVEFRVRNAAERTRPTEPGAMTAGPEAPPEGTDAPPAAPERRPEKVATTESPASSSEPGQVGRARTEARAPAWRLAAAVGGMVVLAALATLVTVVLLGRRRRREQQGRRDIATVFEKP